MTARIALATLFHPSAHGTRPGSPHAGLQRPRSVANRLSEVHIMLWKRTASLCYLLLISSGIFAMQVDSVGLLSIVHKQIQECGVRLDLKDTYENSRIFSDLHKSTKLSCIQQVSDTLMSILAPQFEIEEGHTDNIEFGHARLHYSHLSKRGTRDGDFCSTIERVTSDQSWFTTISCLASHHGQTTSSKRRKVCDLLEAVCDRRAEPEPNLISVYFILSGRPEYPTRMLTIDFADGNVDRVRIQYSAGNMVYVSLAITRRSTLTVPNLLPRV